MRLMQVMAGGPNGGAEGFFERLAVALARTGIEQRLSIRRDPARYARLVSAGLCASQHRFGGPIDLVTPWQLQREAQMFQPDITLAWMSRAARMAPTQPGILVARLGGYYPLKYYRRCQHLIGNTRNIVDYLVNAGWPRQRAHYLPNFVNVTQAEPEPRELHETGFDEKIILALGRLHRNKGFDVLLAALAQVPDAILWLAGAGPEERPLRQLAETLGVAERVRWLGWRQEIGGLFRAADVFVCPSRHEPLGNVVIEAWAHRVPVVAAAATGPAALIDHGKSGLLAPIEDAGALAAGLKQVLQHGSMAQDMAEAGHRAFAARFSETVVVRQYADFFHTLLR